MSNAVFVILGNVVVAALFAAAFFALAFSKDPPKSAGWFATSYAVGMLTPLSELGVRFTLQTSLFMWCSFISFLAALLMTAAALSIHLHKKPPWRMIGVLFVASLIVRILIWGGPRNTMPYELIYQLPFAAATLLCWWVAHRNDEKSGGLKELALLFLVLSIHFIFKAQAAVIVGSGATARAYASSTYALVSQSLTGVLLSAAGLLLLYLLFADMLTRARMASETDILSGLLNRRGFEAAANGMIERTRMQGKTLAMILFDLDHFKVINDTYGHTAGDEVIRQFALILSNASLVGSISARVGGEEFAVLCQCEEESDARLFAEVIRAQTESRHFELFAISTSAGVALARDNICLDTLFSQADSALYSAKEAGRNQVKAFNQEYGELESYRHRNAASHSL